MPWLNSWQALDACPLAGVRLALRPHPKWKRVKGKALGKVAAVIPAPLKNMCKKKGGDAVVLSPAPVGVDAA